MIDIHFELSEFKKFLSAFEPKHHAALYRAWRSEIYRISQAEKARLRKGIDPARSPLAAATGKTGGKAALKSLASMAGYDTADHGLEMTAAIGFGGKIKRKRALPLGVIGQLFEGRSITVSRELQLQVIAKIERRAGRNAVEQYTKGRKNIMIPKIGHTLKVPRRPVVDIIAREETRQTARNIQILYSRVLRGEKLGSGR